MLNLSELRAEIAWADRVAFEEACDRLQAVDGDIEETEDRVRRGEQSPPGGARQILAKVAGRRLSAMKAGLEEYEAGVVTMLDEDASLPRPDDTLQLVHLRERLEGVKRRALTLLDLAERSGGLVRAERLKRVQEQLPEIERLTALIRKLEGASEVLGG
jgi:hypothetical protein